MNRTNVYQRLAEKIIPEVVQPFDYREKYFLMKKIKDAIPSLEQEEIYRIINCVCGEYSSPIKKNRFIKNFIISMKN